MGGVGRARSVVVVAVVVVRVVGGEGSAVRVVNYEEWLALGAHCFELSVQP